MSGHRNRFEPHRLNCLLSALQWARNLRGYSFRMCALFCKRLVFLSLILLSILVVIGSPRLTAFGQSLARLEISGSDTTNFPEVVLQLDAWDNQGNFLSGLAAQDMEVLEESARIQPEQIEVAQSSLQVTLALNVSPVLATQMNGVSQYEQLRLSILEWARSMQSQSKDDFSMATPTGLYLIHSTHPDEWIQALGEYQPDLEKIQPSLNSLAEGLNLAVDSGAPVDGPRRRAVLFITPPLPASMDSGLSELTNHASELGVKVFVWLIAPSTSTPVAADHPLRLLAESTGGTFQQIYPPESNLNIKDQLEPLRNVYQVRYLSSLKQSGDHPVSVRVARNDQVLVSGAEMVSVSVQSPNPIFLSPPVKVERTWDVAASAGAGDASLTPDEVKLQIVVEFPDKHTRALRSSRLFVDGVMALENTSEPFDQFTWRVDGITQSSQHMLRVEVEDELGLTGASMEFPVDVKVAAPIGEGLPVSVLGGISSRNLIILGAVLLSGLALGWVVLVQERKPHRTLPSIKGSRMNRQASGRKASDPAVSKTMPATSRTVPVPSRMGSSALNHSGVFEPGTAAPARLVNLNENEQPVVGAAILLTDQEITFGSDAQRATHVLESPTVDGLHARLYRIPNGCFYLADENSVAGTWINYAPITGHGARLEHGDLVHIGRLMFRFELSDPTQGQQLQIKVVGPDDTRVPQGAGDPK